MARRPKFGTGGNVAGSVIKNILQMQGVGADEAPAEEEKAPRTRKPSAPFTAEQIAADPVLSGKMSYDQARINFIKYQRALNKMPLATQTGKKYTKQLDAARKALSKLGGNAQEAERQFFALGGKLTGVGKTQGSDAGWSAQSILNYWRDAGMEEKGYDIVAKLRGYDRFGNDIPGGIDTSKNINYTFGPEYQTRMKSNIAGLNTLQAAKITKLRNLKQAGTTLTPRQQAALKRLRALKKG